MTKDNAWLTLAACKGMNTEMFFPVSRNGGSAAKEVCASCQARPGCLRAAMEEERKGPQLGMRWGIRGGLTGEERQALARRVVRSRRQHKAVDEGTPT